jgi:hypothetical protein
VVDTRGQADDPRPSGPQASCTVYAKSFRKLSSKPRISLTNVYFPRTISLTSQASPQLTSYKVSSRSSYRLNRRAHELFATRHSRKDERQRAIVVMRRQEILNSYPSHSMHEMLHFYDYSQNKMRDVQHHVRVYWLSNSSIAWSGCGSIKTGP